jgi:hypothetical protein
MTDDPMLYEQQESKMETAGKLNFMSVLSDEEKETYCTLKFAVDAAIRDSGLCPDEKESAMIVKTVLDQVFFFRSRNLFSKGGDPA